MSGRKSRSKGQRGEREAAELLEKLVGGSWRRSQQFKGTATSCDVEPVEIETKLWVESKRDEATIGKRLYDILKRADDECGDNIPFVMSRRNHENWVFCIDENHIDAFCTEYMRLKELNNGPASSS